MSNKENNQNLLSSLKNEDKKMKYRLFLIILTGTLLITACSPTTSSVEKPAAEDVVETPEAELEPALDSQFIDDDIVEVSFSEDVWPILEK